MRYLFVSIIRVYFGPSPKQYENHGLCPLLWYWIVLDTVLYTAINWIAQV